MPSTHILTWKYRAGNHHVGQKGGSHTGGETAAGAKGSEGDKAMRDNFI